MDDELLATALERAGFTSYGAAVYVALLGLGCATARDVATASGVPQGRVYSVIDRLEREGYVETVRDGTLRVRIDQTTPLVDELDGRAARLNAARERIRGRYHETVSAAESRGNESSESEETNEPSTLERIRARVERAERAVWAALSPTAFANLAADLRRAHDRGVDVRVALNDPEQSMRAEACDGVCTEARRRDLPGPTLAVVDWSWAAFALEHEQVTTTEYGAVVADTPAHASVFHWYFVTCLWDGWPVVYAAEVGGLPVCYTELRACVDEVRRHVDAGHAVHVRVEGYDVQSGRRRDIDGVVTDVVVEHPSGDRPEHHRDQAALGRYSGRVSLVVETASATVTVGGRGALVEDVCAERVTVLAVCERASGEKRAAADSDSTA